MHRAGERHVSAVTRSRDAHARRVEIGLLLYPVEERTDVLHRIFPLRAVVELEKALPEARRAAHVGIDDRDAKLVQVVVVAADEAGTELGLGTAVDAHDDGALAGEPRRRMVVKARDVESIEGLPLDEPGLRELSGIEPGAAAIGPARDLVALHVVGVDVARGARGTHVKADLGGLEPPFQTADHPTRKRWRRR